MVDMYAFFYLFSQTLMRMTLGSDKFEVEDIVYTLINFKSQAHKYKAWFRGYDPKGDTWLPSPTFNRKVSFQSTSMRGRKQKYVILILHLTFWDQPSEAKLRKTSSQNQQVALNNTLAEYFSAVNAYILLAIYDRSSNDDRLN